MATRDGPVGNSLVLVLEVPRCSVSLTRYLVHGRHDTEIVLNPVPTADPNDPLNWSMRRKLVNFGLCCYYTLMLFVGLDILTVIYGPLMTNLALNAAVLTNGFGLSTAGLALGCIFLIPFALQFGRRPLYLFSTLVSFGMAILAANVKGPAGLYAFNFIQGFAGSASEAICQMTIADLFFVHQRATMNGMYLIMQSTGAYFGPVVAGFIATNEGWQWQVGPDAPCRSLTSPN